MKAAAVLLIFASLSAVSAVKNMDEHTKLLACSDLARTRFDDKIEIVDEILKRSSAKSYEKASIKLLADMIETCEGKIDLTRAKEIVADENGERTEADFALVDINYEGYRTAGATFNLSKDQSRISVDYIEKDALIEEREKREKTKAA
ncbi:MAG: hypothetical protein V2I33_20565 [Kangiellaceae bacterium]|jgi:hypothetical protein|nr:hypothetical protein [Kangiellaceae bacterium]